MSRLVKLIFSLCTFALSLSILTFGIVAATSANYTATGNVSYSIEDVFCTINCNMTGAHTGDPTKTYTWTTGTDSTVINSHPTWQVGSFGFDKDYPQDIIILTVSITNISGIPIYIYQTWNPPAASAHLFDTSSAPNVNAKITVTFDKTLKTNHELAPGATLPFALSFKLKSDLESFTSPIAFDWKMNISKNKI